VIGSQIVLGFRPCQAAGSTLTKELSVLTVGTFNAGHPLQHHSGRVSRMSGTLRTYDDDIAPVSS
jgi:hypothetical protein